MAGYSGTPLAQKLGAKPGLVVVQLGGPDGLLPEVVVVRRRLPAAADVVLGLKLVVRKELRRATGPRRAQDPQ